MILEDYYKILGVTINSSLYKISFRYFKLSRAILNNSPEYFGIEKLEQLSRAFSVLSQSNPKKFYDILYLQYINNNIDTTDSHNQKYLKLLEPIINQGNIDARKLFDISDREKSIYHQSWASIYYDYLLYPGFRIRAIPSVIVAYCLIILTFINFFSNHDIINKIYVFIIINIISLSIMIINFRNFIIIKINQKNSL